MAHKLFALRTNTRIDNSLYLIDDLLQQHPTSERDGHIQEQIRLIRELIRPPTSERKTGYDYQDRTKTG